MARLTTFSYSRGERLNDPERPTNIAEVVEDIVKEERAQKSARRQQRFLPAVTPAEPCAESPSGAHWWRYPAQGTRGKVRCKFCKEVQ